MEAAKTSLNVIPLVQTVLPYDAPICPSKDYDRILVARRHNLVVEIMFLATFTQKQNQLILIVVSPSKSVLN